MDGDTLPMSGPGWDRTTWESASLGSKGRHCPSPVGKNPVPLEARCPLEQRARSVTDIQGVPKVRSHLTFANKTEYIARGRVYYRPMFFQFIATHLGTRCGMPAIMVTQCSGLEVSPCRIEERRELLKAGTGLSFGELCCQYSPEIFD